MVASWHGFQGLFPRLQKTETGISYSPNTDLSSYLLIIGKQSHHKAFQ